LHDAPVLAVVGRGQMQRAYSLSSARGERYEAELVEDPGPQDRIRTARRFRLCEKQPGVKKIPVRKS